VAWCNKAVHEAPWVKGDTTTLGGIFIALELADQAYEAHGLTFNRCRMSEAHLSDLQRFTWVYDPAGETRDCIKIRDDRTGRVVVWPHF
jgi:hypothetical protein